MTKEEFKNKIILITYGVILFVFLMNYKWIGNIVSFIIKIMTPFIIGGIIAFVLNVLVNIIEAKLLPKMKKGKRILSIILSLLLVFGFIIILLFILIPQIRNAGSIFLDNLPEYQETIYDIGSKLGISTETLEKIDLSSDKIKEQIASLLSNNYEYIIDISMVFANSVFSAFANFFVGLVFAIYVLLDKESLQRRIKKLLRKIFPKKAYERMIKVFSLSNETFSNFVKVQVLEAFILGMLCFLMMLIFRLPYAATISVLVGFTALIPIFGAFIGCGVGAFLIFMISPLKALLFICLFLILQQIEGNFIYPHVVGGKIGLPSIWVLVAVTIGGSLGGILGMLIGVPLLSVIYSLLKVYVNNSKEKDA